MFRIKGILFVLFEIVAIFFLAGCVSTFVKIDRLPHDVPKGYVEFHFKNEHYLAAPLAVEEIVQGAKYELKQRVCDSFNKIARVATTPGMHKYRVWCSIADTNEKYPLIEINVVEGMVKYVTIEMQRLDLAAMGRYRLLGQGRGVYYRISVHELGMASIEEADEEIEDLLKNEKQ